MRNEATMSLGRALFFLLFIFSSSPLFTLSASAASMPFGKPSIKDLKSGKTLPLELAKDKRGLVLIFLSIKCPCSNGHLEHLKKLKEEFFDFSFFGVHSNQDESIQSAETFFKARDLGLPVFHDERAVLADKLGALKTPHAFILGPQGEVLFQGGLTNSMEFERAGKFYLKEALTQIRQGKLPDSQKAKTIGCYISR